MSPVVRSVRVAAAVVSGVLLALSFPPFGLAGLAWLALAPLLLALVWRQDAADTGLGASFRLGYITGLVFWLVSMVWMLTLFQTSPAPAPLIAAGWLLLSAYCALYTGGFAVTVAWTVRRLNMARLWQTALLTLVVPVFWAGWEMARAVLFTGFPWNLLGISQYRNLVLIQGAEWTGVIGISALVMLANSALALTLLRYLPPRETRYRPHVELFIGLLTIALAFRGGVALVRQHAAAEGGASLVVVQPAIPQVKKWSQEQIDLIHATFRRLTRLALQAEETLPDLVIWPETATPYCVTEEGESRDLVMELSRLGAPLLVGSMDVTNQDGELICYNGSFLFDTNGVVAGRYYKQHLVPFGEYIPLSGWIPWLANFAPMGWNCLPGREATVLAGGGAGPFSCLICFEDIMPGLSRVFVGKGARLLVNQTNDAWFDRSAGPVQHLAHSVFRAVENRVPVVRVGNSGISCVVQPNGLVTEASENDRTHPPVGYSGRLSVAVPDEAFRTTAFTRYGDWLFGLPCLIATAIVFLCAMVTAWRRRTPAAPLTRGGRIA